jgi:hypothetical protein
MKLLDAMNYCLRMTGHSSVNDPDDVDPNAQSSKATIRRTRRKILNNGYPFNRDIKDMGLGTNGRIAVDRNLLRVELPIGLSVRKDPSDNPAALLMWVWDIEKDDWHDAEIKNVGHVFDIDNVEASGRDFERIPEDFANWIQAESAAMFYFENNQTNHVDLQRESASMSATAINSLPPESIHVATGYSSIRGIGGGGTGVTSITGRVWINVG